MEQFYVGQGWLIPTFHKAYWIGLAATTWPNFRWLDGSAPPSEKSYAHWGLLLPQGVPVSGPRTRSISPPVARLAGL